MTRLINTHDQLVAAGGGVAIMTAHTQGRSSRACGWAVYRVNAQGEQVATNAKAAWYEDGRKTFYWRVYSDKNVALESAQEWIAENCGEAGPWKRNAARDYVPERIQKQFPISKKEEP
jgi:hypothetical protein